MREIKFRAWFGEQSVIFEKPYLEAEYTVLAFNPKDEELQGICRLGCDNCIPDCIEQFTGLKDKNGVEIYDGDILKVKVNMRKPVPENERQSQWDTVRLVPSYEKWTVEYCERYSQGNGFYCFGKDRRFNTHITKSKLYNTEAEIIGNIHDNPELLKGE